MQFIIGFIDFTELPEAFNEGLVITLVGYSIVFFSLVALYLFFKNFSRILNTNLKNKLRREGKHKEAELPDITGEETAAISMALYLFNDVHDEESNVITIKNISKSYSPWSTKSATIKRFSR